MILSTDGGSFSDPCWDIPDRCILVNQSALFASTSPLINSTDPTQALADSLKAAVLDDSIQFISISPAGARETQSSLVSDRRDTSIRTNALALASPSSSNDMARHGAGYTPSNNSSPTARRHQEIMESPSWRRGEGFVRQSARVDDPFVSNRTSQGSSQGE